MCRRTVGSRLPRGQRPAETISGMALIESLERDSWQGFFTGRFEFALWIPHRDRLAPVRSSACDFRTRPVAGELPRIGRRLGSGPKRRQASPDRVAEVTQHIGTPERECRSEQRSLARDEVTTSDDKRAVKNRWLDDVRDMLQGIARGGRSCHDWKEPHRYTREDPIAACGISSEGWWRPACCPPRPPRSSVGAGCPRPEARQSACRSVSSARSRNGSPASSSAL